MVLTSSCIPGPTLQTRLLVTLRWAPRFAAWMPATPTAPPSSWPGACCWRSLAQRAPRVGVWAGGGCTVSAAMQCSTTTSADGAHALATASWGAVVCKVHPATRRLHCCAGKSLQCPSFSRARRPRGRAGQRRPGRRRAGLPARGRGGERAHAGGEYGGWHAASGHGGCGCSVAPMGLPLGIARVQWSLPSQFAAQHPACAGPCWCQACYISFSLQPGTQRTCCLPMCCARCAALQDDAEHQRELYATILNQLVMNFLDSSVGRWGPGWCCLGFSAGRGMRGQVWHSWEWQGGRRGR